MGHAGSGFHHSFFAAMLCSLLAFVITERRTLAAVHRAVNHPAPDLVV
jgi:hypothetical protein